MCIRDRFPVVILFSFFFFCPLPSRVCHTMPSRSGHTSEGGSMAPIQVMRSRRRTRSHCFPLESLCFLVWVPQHSKKWLTKKQKMSGADTGKELFLPRVQAFDSVIVVRDVVALRPVKHVWALEVCHNVMHALSDCMAG